MNTDIVVKQQHPTESNERRDKEHPQGGPVVTVVVDSSEYTLHRGSYIVTELKAAVGIPAEKELDQLIDGQLTPLEDSARIVIKGGEEFISHVRAGGSS